MSDQVRDPVALVQELGSVFAGRIAHKDQHDEFVTENYAALREGKFFSAMVPTELGGGGASHSQMCTALRTLARYCSSTALACSMHQHLIATLRFNYMNGRPGEKPLRAVAAKELVLVSTGAGDWLASKGNAQKVDGGFLVSGRKIFCSGVPEGGIFVTSFPYESATEGWQVLHLAVPLSAEGITVANDWQAMGMRATGSHSVVFSSVFVSEEAVVMRRPRGQYHPFFDLVITVALPLVMSVYTGIAEAAVEIADRMCAKQGEDGVHVGLLGETHTQLTMAQLAHAEMVRLCNDWDFKPSTERACKSLTAKAIVAETTQATVRKAIEAVGGAAFFRSAGLERLMRDVTGAQFHPLPARKQQEFVGRAAMGLPPPDEMQWATSLAQAAE
jgi:alkylation response protein AidB-like acyl-CoA dehydrogenase